VLVVGAGPAGLEAARVAALRGHRVTLYERRERLGGAYGLIAALPGRDAVASVPSWYADRLGELGVEIRLGVEATTATLNAVQPDAVILATGARFEPTGTTGFIAEPIPGWQRDFVYTPEQVLEDGVIGEGNVVILDEEGQSTAAGIAELMAGQGARVELVTRWQMAIPRLQGSGQFAWVLTRLYAAGVVLTPNTYVKEIGERSVTLFNIFTNEERVVENVGAVVLVGSRKPEAALASELSGQVGEIFVIGDSAAPRTLFEASYEGHRAGREV